MSTAVSLPPVAIGAERRLAAWWPLAALVVLAAGLRLATLDQQSLWYDEAYTPVHVLHPSLWATLRSVANTENTPPLWYLLVWADTRLFGTGAVALRLPSALAGIAAVPVVWAIGLELGGRRAGLIAAALVATSPLFVWYSQEARAYALFVLLAALTMLRFLRAEREPTPRRLAAFALAGSLALLTHYFAVFLLIPMALWLLRERSTRRAALPAIAALAIVGVALLGLISAQGGHGTQWIGRWALSSRLQAIAQYFLTGYSGAPLGHGLELLVALPILAGLGLGLARLLERGRGDAMRHGAMLALLITAAAILTPIVLAVLGADYLAPRNLLGGMIALTALIAVAFAAADRQPPRQAAPPAGTREPARRPTLAGWIAARAGTILAAVTAAAFLALSIDVDLSPRLQRGNWRDLARAVGAGAGGRVITTVELGSAPLEYYLAPLRHLPRRASVTVREIDETGYSPLRPGAARPPVVGFRLVERRNVDGLLLYRFVSPVARTVSEAALRRHVITPAHPEVLVPARPPVPAGPARAGAGRAQAAPSAKTT
jgi:4-amino-4-deoxy-L-arabinose transferase-like glycosyltransferase